MSAAQTIAGRPAVPATLREFLRAGPVMWLLVRREFRARYAGSTLGVVWNVVHPLVLIGIYVLVFSSVMKDRAGGGTRMDYAVHLTAGMIPWFFFSEVVARCTTVLVDNANFLKKLAMPAEVLHVGVLINSFLVHLVGLAGLVVFLLLVGVPVSPSVLFAVPVMMALGIVALGLGLILSVLHLVLRDIGQFVTIGLQFLFWLTPIVYYISILPPKVAWLIQFNPILGYVSLVQRLFGSTHHGFVPEAWHAMGLLPFALLLMGLAFLRRHRMEILDEL